MIERTFDNALCPFRKRTTVKVMSDAKTNDKQVTEDEFLSCDSRCNAFRITRSGAKQFPSCKLIENGLKPFKPFHHKK